MSANEINAAIAEIVGWKFVPCHDDGFGRATGELWLDPDGDTAFDCPDYFHDLNACAQFEATITTHDMFHEYSSRLHGNVSATAPQRCEAFLRAHGK